MTTTIVPPGERTTLSCPPVYDCTNTLSINTTATNNIKLSEASDAHSSPAFLFDTIDHHTNLIMSQTSTQKSLYTISGTAKQTKLPFFNAMKKITVSCLMIASFMMMGKVSLGQTVDFNVNAAMTTASNYSNNVLPNNTTDVRITTSNAGLLITSGSVIMRSLSITNGTTYSLTNATSTSTSRTLTIGNTVSFTNPSSTIDNDIFYLSNNSVLNFTGANSDGGTGVINLVLARSGNFNVDGAGTTLNIGSATGGIISGINSAIGITKTGTGTLELSGANTYSGSTTVSAGVLRLNRPGGGTLPSGHTVIIKNGGTLQVSTNQQLSYITLEEGGTLIVDNGVALSSITGFTQKGGNIILNGSATMSYASSTSIIKYAGTSTQTTTSIEIPSLNGPWNIEVDNPAGVIVGTPSSLQRGIYLSNGNLDNSSNNITLGNNAYILRKPGGSISATPELTGTLIVSYQGVGSIITGPEIPTASNILTQLELFTSEPVSLGANVNSVGSIYFGGFLRLGNYDITTSSFTNNTSTRYIITDGSGVLTVKNISATPVLFPVGPSASSYTPITVSNGNGEDFSVRTHSTFTNTPFDPTRTVNVEWIITKTGVQTGNNVTLTTQWNASDEAGSFNRNGSLVLGHYGTSSWDETAVSSSSVAGGGPYTATINGVSSFSPFAIGNTNAFVPLSSNTDYFRTITSGSWNAPATWESSPVADFSSGVVSPATLAPNNNASGVTVRSGHTVTLTAGVTISSTLTVDGILDCGANTASGNGNLVINGTVKTANALGLFAETAGATFPNTLSSISIGEFAIIEYNGGDQSVLYPIPLGILYPTIIISGTGTKTIANHTELHGNLTINSSATLDAVDDKEIYLYGSWINNGNFIARNGAIYFYPADASTTIGGSSATTFHTLGFHNQNGTTFNQDVVVNSFLFLNGPVTNDNHLAIADGATLSRTSQGSITNAPTFGNTVNLRYVTQNTAITTGPEVPVSASVVNNLDMMKASGSSPSNTVILGSAITVNGTFTSANCVLKLGNFNLTAYNPINPSLPVVTGRFIITDGTGSVIMKNVGSTPILVPIGSSGTSLTPITISNGGGADFSVRVHQTFTNTPSDPTKVVNAEWIITKTGSQTGNNVTLTPAWKPTDEAASFDRNGSIVLGHYGASSWDETNAGTVSGPESITNLYSVTINGVNSFSPFAIGNANAFVASCIPPSIAGDGQPLATQTVCQNGTPANLTVTATGTGTLTYQWYVDNNSSGYDGTAITGATGSSYTPATWGTGTLYYYCVVTGDCGTAAKSSYAEVILTSLSLSTSTTVATCPTLTNGSATVSASGGSGSYTYNWHGYTANATLDGQNGWNGGIGGFTNNNAGDNNIVNSVAHNGSQSWYFKNGYNSPGQGTPFTPAVASVGALQYGAAGNQSVIELSFKPAVLNDGSRITVYEGSVNRDDRTGANLYIENIGGGMVSLYMFRSDNDGPTNDYSAQENIGTYPANVWNTVKMVTDYPTTNNSDRTTWGTTKYYVNGVLVFTETSWTHWWRYSHGFAYTPGSGIKFTNNNAGAGFYIDDVSMIVNNTITNQTVGSYYAGFEAGTSSSATYSGLSAGTYTVTVTDANGCKAITTATVMATSIFPVHNVSTGLNYCTIQAAIDAASPNDIITVDAGIYTENIVVNKSLTINGPNAGIDGCSPSRGAEAIIIPAAGVATTGTATSKIINVTADNVTINGFTLNGDNPGLSSAFQANGADIDVDMGISCEAMATGDKVSIKNNIIKNVFQFGVVLGTTGGAAKGGEVVHNKIDNIPYWAAILCYDDYYATISNNCISNAWMGVQVDNFYQPKPVTAVASIASNTITTQTQAIAGDATYTDVHGIRINNIYQNTSTWSVTNNQVTNTTVGSDAGSTGLELWSVQTAVAVSVSGNTIDGFESGYYLWNCPTTNTINISGSAANCTNGVLATNKTSSYGSANSSYILSNLTLTNCTNGVKVFDDPAALPSQQTNIEVNITSGVTITGGTTGLLIENTRASLPNAGSVALSGQSGNYIYLINNANNVLATSASFAGQTGASASLAQNFAIEDKIVHKIDWSNLGFVSVKANNDYVTVNSFITPNTTTPEIQRAIDAASDGYTVNIGPGSYTNVSASINKSLTFLGNNSGISGLASRNPESFIDNSLFLSNTTFSIDPSKTVSFDGIKFATKRFISFAAGDNITVKNSVCNWKSTDPGEQHIDANGSTFTSLTFQDNDVTVNGPTQQAFQLFGTSLTGSNNTILIKGNHFFGGIPVPGDGVRPVILNLDYIQGEISSNDFDQVDIGVLVATGCGNLTIKENDFHGLVRSASNHASNSYAAGVVLFNPPLYSAPINILNNYFRLSDVGVRTCCGAPDFTGQTININYNSFTGNNFFNIRNLGTGNPFSATCNWYGTVASGAIASSIVGPVTYSPYLTSGTDNQPATIGFQTSAVCTTVNDLYVNDNDLTGDVNGGTVGNDANPGTQASPFLTIQHAIDVAAAGNTIHVDAGTYVENLVINKPLDIQGPNYNVNPNTGLRVGEAIIMPAINDAENGVLVDIEASNVLFKGFLLNGDNPSLSGGYAVGGADVNTSEGMQNAPVWSGPFAQIDHLTIENNIFSNFDYQAIYLEVAQSSNHSWNYIKNNKFDNMWEGVQTYALHSDISDNVFTAVDRALSVHVVDAACDAGFVPKIANNEVSINSKNPNATTRNVGIWVNYRRGNAPALSVTNNTLHFPETAPGGKKLIGFYALTITDDRTVTFSGNIIDGQSNCHRGFYMSNSPSANVSISGGSFNNIKDYGVLMVNNDATWGAGDARLTISNLPVTMAAGSTAAVAVDAPVANSPYVGVLDISNSTLSGSSTGVLVKGSLASANIHNNASTITGFATGVDVDGGSASLFQNNIHTNGTGVRVKNSGALTSTTQNFIKNNTGDGILIEASAGAIGPINNNDLSGNGGFAINNGKATIISNATCNWYGSATASAVAAEINGPVNYVPWLTNGNDNDANANNGFQPVLNSCNGVLTEFYVNDGFTAGDHYTATTGNDANPGSAALPFRTIQHAIDVAPAGSVIWVDAGTYAENVDLNKQLTIKGSNYGVNPNTGSRVAESIVVPATSDPDPNSVTAVDIFYIEPGGSGSTVDGFTFDGDNPALIVNGIDAVEAISAYDGIADVTVSNNIVKNLSYTGIDFYNYTNSGAPTTGNTITANKLDNIIGDYGIGILIYNNCYTDVTNNVMTNVRVGVQTGNFYQADPGSSRDITGNTITSYRKGIWHNLAYSNASTFNIANNVINTTSGAPNNDGIAIGSIQGTTAVTVTNNNVTGARSGVNLWNCPTSNTVTITGGILTNCKVGVFANNYDGYSSNATSSVYAMTGVTTTNCDTAVWVRDNASNSNGATVALNINNATNNINGTGIGVLIEGGDASVALTGAVPINFSISLSKYFRYITNGTNVPTGNINALGVQFGGTNGAGLTDAQLFAVEDKIDHKIDWSSVGFVSVKANNDYVTVNSFYTPNTTTALVQRGVDAASTGWTVNVNSGTYADPVNINKGIKLYGINYNISPNGGSRNPEAKLATASGIMVNVTTTDPVEIKGFEIANAGGSFDYSLTGTVGTTVDMAKNFFNNSIGCYFPNAVTTTVVDNKCTFSSGADEGFALFGDYNGTTGSYADIHDNVFINGQMTGFNLSNIHGVVYKNKFSSIAYYGVLVANLCNLDIYNNVFNGIVNPGGSPTYGSGVRFYTPTPGMIVNVRNNYFTNNAIGVAVRNVGGDGNLTGTTININRNSFTGNTDKNFKNEAAQTLTNATCNWYGTTNPATIAASISGSVNYTPYLNDGTDDDNSTLGFQTDEQCGACTLVIQSISSNNVSCYGRNNGSATVNISGATNPTYLWSPGGQTTATISGLAPGIYTVTVTEGNGCTKSESVTITEPLSPLSIIVLHVYDLICNGDNSGVIDLFATGGTPGYTYSWSNGETTEDIHSVPAGVYTLTVTDANGCTAQETRTITEPPALIASSSVSYSNTPGPVTSTSSFSSYSFGSNGPGAAIGTGKTWFFTNFFEYAYAGLWWTFNPIANPTHSSQGSGGNMVFSGYDNLTGIATFVSTNNIQWTNALGQPENIPTRMRIQFQPHTGIHSGPLASGWLTPVTAGSIGLGSLPSGWPLIDEKALPYDGRFQVWFVIENAITGTPLNDYYGSYPHTSSIGGSVQTSVSGNFFTSAQVPCGGFAAVTVSATGGTAPYTGTGTFNVSAGTYTYTVTDSKGCTGSTTINVDPQLEDITPPDPIGVSDFTGTCYFDLATPSALDNCDGFILGTTTTPLPITAQGTTEVTWTFTDNSGNTSTYVQKVTLIDNQPPASVALSDIISQCPVTPPTPIAGDNCAGGVPGTTTTVFPITAQGTTVVTWTFDDGNGNTSTTTQNVIIHDNIPPSIICPANINHAVDPGQCTYSFTPTQATGSDNCGNVIITGTRNDNLPLTNPYPIGTTTITWKADDGNGNNATCQQTVTVTEAILNLACPANIMVNADAGQCSAVVNYTAPSAPANCDPTLLTTTFADGNNHRGNMFDVVAQNTLSITGFDVHPIANTTVAVYYKAGSYVGSETNAGAWTLAGTAAVTAQPIGTPTPLPLAMNVTILAGQTYSFYITSTNTGVSLLYTDGTTEGAVFASDANLQFLEGIGLEYPFAPGNAIFRPRVWNGVIHYKLGVGHIITQTAGLSSGSAFPVGTTTNTFEVRDGLGNLESTCSFNVKVKDAQPPVITCPANIEVANDPGQCGAIVTFDATASDNCPGVNVSYNHASGSLFPSGTTTVTATATDVAGNTASCSFTVKVTDPIPPIITCPSNVSYTISSGCSKSIAVTNPTKSDNCSVAKLTWVMTGATTGSSPTSGTNYVGTKTFNTGVTTITYTVTDGAGNSTSCSFTVTVKETTPPSISCPGDKTVNTDAGVCYATNVNLGNATASDNCCVPIVTNNAPASFPKGITYVVWTATDLSGNIKTCTQKITVVDNQDPVITCPANITQAADANSCSASVTVPDPVYSDNCVDISKLTWVMTGATTGSSLSTGIYPVGTQTFNVGVTTVTYTVKDGASRSRTCSFTVTVTPGGAQTLSITCPTNISQSASANSCNGNVSVPNPTISYGCGTGKLTWVMTGATTGSSPTSGINYVGNKTFNPGVTTIKYTLKDASGQSVDCSFTVTITDPFAPVITCPSNVSYTISSGCSKSISIANLTASTLKDNCGVVKLTWVMTGATTGSSSSSGINYIGTKTYNAGVTTVSYTATDGAGNSTSCSFTVTVKETTLPSISCPGDKTVNTDAGVCYATNVNLGNPTASDNCCVPIVTNNAPATFPKGITYVVWTATDLSGNIKTCTQKITVVDNQDPVITCPANITQAADANNCSASIAVPDPTYSDNCGDISKLTWVMTGSTTASSPATGINKVNTKTFNAGITTVTYTVTDGSGRTKTCNFTVTVTSSGAQALNITCPVSIEQSAGVNDCNGYVQVPNPTISYGCGSGKLTWVMTGATTGSSPSNGINYVGNKTFNPGVTTIKYTLKDASGQTVDCSFTVTITDNIAPVISCPANITANASANSCSKSITIPNLTSSMLKDNCGVVKLTWAMTGATTGNSAISGINYVGTKTFNVGTTTITYTATDGAGNTSSCSFTVIVSGNSIAKPTITANGPLTFCQGGSVTLTSSLASENLWSNGATTKSIVVSTPGSYSVTNINGCSAASDPVTVTVNPLPGGTISSLSATVCENSPASVVFNATSGTGPYKVVINGVTYENVFNGSTIAVGNSSSLSNYSLWTNSTVPATAVENDGQPLEVGMKFRVSANGVIKSIRFYKGSNNDAGNYVLKLYQNSNQALLASVNFNNKTATGWQTVDLPVPVSVTAGTTYLASYYSPSGNYANNNNYFTTARINGPITGLANGTEGGNGVYRYGSGGGFPTSSYQASNYWVDVVFSGSGNVTLNLTSIKDVNSCTVSGNLGTVNLQVIPCPNVLTRNVVPPKSVEDNKTIPDKPALGQNHPNPFAASTLVDFSIPGTGRVRLTLFDLNGRAVQVLMNEVRDAGSYTIPVRRENLSAGVYYYKLEWNGETLVKKMMILK